MFDLLGRPYDIRLALRIASREVQALQCKPALKPERQDGQRYRPRLVLVDPVGHRLLYAWSYAAAEGLNRIASDQCPSSP